ncbi:MAG: lactonase family protein, partial [Solirubrobacteraceae bacterium]
RNTETGALTPLSPASVAAGENPDGVVISGDGKSVYVNNRFGDSVSQYSRNAETGKLTPLSPATVPAGVEVHGIAISPDNKTVYAANAQSEDVSQYSRNAETGALTPLSPATVKTGDEPFEIAVSPDNESVYVTNDDENGLSEPSISQFNRNTETGALSALSPASVETGTHPYGITISPDGRFIYVANKEMPEVAGRIYAYARTTGGSGTFGKTTVGASSDEFAANRKRVNRYALPTAGSVTKLSIYLAPTTTSGSQVMEGIVYSDSSGTPSTLLGTTKPLTFTSTSAAGWYELSFATPLNLAVGNYWIGVITGATGDVAGYRYESVSGSRDYNTNTYTSGPTTTFGTVTPDSQQMSLYATYTIG